MKIKMGYVLAAALVSLSGVTQAQESNFDISVGLKAWRAEWTTFSYDDTGTFITQVPAKDKTVFIPQISARYKEFVGSVSAFQPTNFEFLDGSKNRRKEFDLNLGWLATPGVALSVGYKTLAQRAAENNYEVAGPTVSVSGTAPVRGPFSIYGTFGYGRMKDTSSSTVHFDANYQLLEAGGAYNLALGGTPRALTFTLGYRMQVLNSKDALPGQDGRDLTRGFVLGAFAVF